MKSTSCVVTLLILISFIEGFILQHFVARQHFSSFSRRGLKDIKSVVDILPESPGLSINHSISSPNCEMNSTAGEVVVCANKYCQAKGGEATFSAFSLLCPLNIPVKRAICLGKCGKGPNVYIVTPRGDTAQFSFVNSVEKVVNLLETYFHVDINKTTAEVFCNNRKCQYLDVNDI